jgi:DNA-binding Lrp family transcriptional regulator
MVHAFIMVKAATGDAGALAERLAGFDHVSVASVVAGEFDVIVEAESTEVYDVINAVATRIREFDDVADTKTYVCLE